MVTSNEASCKNAEANCKNEEAEEDTDSKEGNVFKTK